MTDSEQLDAIRCGLIDLEMLLEKILAELVKFNQPKFTISKDSNPPCEECYAIVGHLPFCSKLNIGRR